MDTIARVEVEPEVKAHKKQKITWIVFSLLSLFLLIGVMYYFFIFRFYQSTDNAYVQADLTWVMPKVTGEVVELVINDNQFVKKGETLAVRGGSGNLNNTYK
ncbi:biotin/lipoyl-binding protein [Acinetobacter haemolyticus]|uniref:Biotin/lipoyl-binding protein n=1 Tax=Acinetobacter haemolyticus TaxID=29430 RepID=A0AAJ3D9J6_ACIHA|nr:biotin/lipoyl-binding protein [Acinetobacter haemolyticus]